jgi:fatty acid desaturase
MKKKPPPYAELRKLVRQAGLMERQLGYYAWRVPVTFLLMVPAIIVIMYADSMWWHVVNGCYMGFVYNQIVFVGHDAGHYQIFGDRRDYYLALLMLPFMGMSVSWWMDTHNKHHGRPNERDFDPSVGFKYLAFSQREAQLKTGFARTAVKYQGLYFLPLMILYPLLMKLTSLTYLYRNRRKRLLLESLLFLVHFPLYLWLLFSYLEPLQALVFVSLHQCVFGLCLFSVFGPNHIGQEVLPQGHGLDYLEQQTMTSQNVQKGLLVDFWFGGLNHQIEHHLFPTVARNRIKHVRPIVEKFCREHGIPYFETSAPRCYIEILQYMHRAGAPLRRGQQAVEELS